MASPTRQQPSLASISRTVIRPEVRLDREQVLAMIRTSSELPTPPAVAFEIIQKASEPECELEDLEAILARDPALCARLLRAVNSCLYGLRHPITSIPAAVRHLGIIPLRSLVLTLSLANLRFSALPHEALESYWRTSVAGALAMRQLAIRARCPFPEDDLVAGLLRDLGILVLHQLFPAEYQPLLENSPAVLSAFQCVLEEGALGTNHAEAGAELLRAWRLPDEITEPIRSHHDWERASQLPEGQRKRAQLLYFASQVACLHTAPSRALLVREVVSLAGEHFQMDGPALRTFLASLEEQMREFAAILQVNIGHGAAFASVLSRGIEELTRLALCATASPSLPPRPLAGPSVLPTPAIGLTQDIRHPDSGRSPARVGPGPAQELQGRLFPGPCSPQRLGELDGYIVERLVGCGAMGAVFRALDPNLDRPVAIKALLPHLAASPDARRRFIREGKAIAALAHENVVPIYAVGEKADIPYLVMEFVEGESLAERLDREAPLPLSDIIRIGLETAAALATAHARGFVHRDIKPANLLIDAATRRLKVADFGLVQDRDRCDPGGPGQIVGTPCFMSPEQADGDRTSDRSDMFSLGSVLYLACTGQLPFPGDTIQEVLAQVREARPRPIRDLNPALPAWLEEIVAGLLARAPERRFPTAAELKRVLLCQWARLVSSRRPVEAARRTPPGHTPGSARPA